MLVFILLVLMPAMMAAARNAVVVDSVTGMPLPRASVFDRKGNPIGISGNDGRMPYATADYYPLSVRYVGYSTYVVPDPACDSIRMQKQMYELPGITVLNEKKDVLYMVGYVREFSTLTTYTDTIQLFREKTVDFMLPAKRTKRLNGWLNPRVLASQSYYRFSTAYGLDSVSNYYRQHFTWADWVGILDRVEIPAALRTDMVGTDTVQGRYCPASIWRRVNDAMYVDVDVLSDTTSRKWIPTIAPFLRGNVDFSRLSVAYSLNDVEGKELRAENISQMSISIESTGRGWRLFQVFPKDQPFFVSTYAELYIIDRAYLTVAQAQQLDQNRPRSADVGIVRPDVAPDLPPAVIDLMARVDGIDHDQRRLGMQPDERLAGKGKGRERFSIVGLVKAAARKVRKFTGW